MFKKSSLVAVLALVMSQTAFANPFINFQGVGNGANVADFYNGGTDSYGNKGTVNYGIHFDATVKYNSAGAYVAGNALMSFAPDIVSIADGYSPFFFVKFQASRYGVDGGFSTIKGPTSSDAVYVAGNGNPYCHSEADCNAKGYTYVYHSTMGGYQLASNGTETSVFFNTDRLDNISFVPDTGPASEVPPGGTRGSAALDVDVPEPASIALVGLGMSGLMLARRRKGAKA
jgi:hypothetical protein